MLKNYYIRYSSFLERPIQTYVKKLLYKVFIILRTTYSNLLKNYYIRYSSFLEQPIQTFVKKFYIRYSSFLEQPIQAYVKKLLYKVFVILRTTYSNLC